MHRQIFEGDETIDYAFMGQDPDASDNRWLREALGLATTSVKMPRCGFISGMRSPSKTKPGFNSVAVK